MNVLIIMILVCITFGGFDLLIENIKDKNRKGD